MFSPQAVMLEWDSAHEEYTPYRHGSGKPMRGDML